MFKLQFKNHVYFFRAESEYTYSRSVNSNAVSIRGVRGRRVVVDETDLCMDGAGGDEIGVGGGGEWLSLCVVEE